MHPKPLQSISSIFYLCQDKKQKWVLHHVKNWAIVEVFNDYVETAPVSTCGLVQATIIEQKMSHG